MPSTCWPTYARTRLFETGRDRVEARLAELPLDVVLLGEAEAAVGVEARVGRLPTTPPRRATSPCSPRRRRAGPARRARPPCSASGRPPRSPRAPARSGTGRPGSRRSAARRRPARTRTPPPSRRTSGRRRCTRPRSGSARRSSRRGCSGSPCPPRRRARPPGTSTPSKKISVVAWFIIVLIGRIVIVPASSACCMSTMKVGQPVGPLLDLVERRRAREQQHQVGVQRARGPDLLAADDVAAVDALRRRLDAASCPSRRSAR